LIKALKLIDQDAIESLFFMACRQSLLLVVAVVGLGGLGLWADAINQKTLSIAIKGASAVFFVSWIISLLILLARRFALASSTQVKSCLAIKRAQQGLAESGPCLCRKHGMYWGNGVISECAHRDGENCVFPCNG
jgi:hypothetical protein